MVAFIDRVNIGFAKLQMATDLGLSEAVYGVGAGIFFLGGNCRIQWNAEFLRRSAGRGVGIVSES